MLQQTKNVIDDGYSREGYIKASEDGTFGEMYVVYRPMLADASEQLSTELQKLSGERAIGRNAQAVKEQLVEWSEVTPEGKPRDITLENLRRLPRYLLVALRQMVQGDWMGDQRPNADEKQATEFAKALEAEAQGLPAGQAVMDADVKN